MSNRVPNVTPKRELLASEELTLDDRPVDLDKARVEGVIDTAVRLDKPLDELAKTEQFYRENVEVMFADPSSETESPIVEANVNGRYFVAKRGSTSSVPRYILEVIARSRVERVKTERQMMPDGSETMVPKITYAPCYPFSVVSDPSGAKGIAWLRNVLSSPA